MRALKAKKYKQPSSYNIGSLFTDRHARYCDFSALFRPHFQTGDFMGQWDFELVSLLPSSVQIFASTGAGFSWADVDVLGEHKIWYANRGVPR